MNDQHRQELLRSSAVYATARLSFANAIVIAQRAGETDQEIAHVTGYTVPMVRAVLARAKPLRSSPRGKRDGCQELLIGSSAWVLMTARRGEAMLPVSAATSGLARTDSTHVSKLG